jgi:uncharacterized membrane protein YoaK (UPF0700 family)
MGDAPVGRVMDAHTYFVRGGVFANVQTGNVIFFAIDLSERKLAAALAHVWSILTFMVGVGLAAHIKSGRVERVLTHPLRWTMAVQVVVLAGVGFDSGDRGARLRHGADRLPRGRSNGPVSQRLRFVESGYDGFVEKQAASVRAFGVYGTLIIGFAGGALMGAYASRAWGAHAIWLAASILAVTLVLFIVDERVLR